MSEKKKFSPSDKCLWFLCLRRQNKPKNISVCRSGCLDIWMYVRTCTFHVDTITFEGVSGSKKKFGGCLPCMKYRSGIEIQSNIMILILILILNRIFIFTKTFTKNFLDIFSIWRITFSNEFHSEILILHMILILILKKQNSEKSLRNKTKFHEYH